MVAKRLLAALVVLMLTGTVMAQDSRVYLGAQAGLGIGLSRPAGDDAKDYRDYMKDEDRKFKAANSFDFGIKADFQLADKFALGTGIGFGRFGYGEKNKDGDWYTTSRMNMVIPVLAKLTLVERKFNIFAGPQLMFGMGQLKDTEKYDGEKESEKYDVPDDYQQQVIGLTFGADFGFEVGPGRLFFDLRYLTSLGAEKWDGEKEDNYTRYAKLAFSVGYEFGLGSR